MDESVPGPSKGRPPKKHRHRFEKGNKCRNIHYLGLGGDDASSSIPSVDSQSSPSLEEDSSGVKTRAVEKEEMSQLQAIEEMKVENERLKERVRLLQLYYFIMKYQKSQKILMRRNHDDKKTSWITYNILMSYQIQVGYRHRMYKNKDAKMSTYKLSLCVKSFVIYDHTFNYNQSSPIVYSSKFSCLICQGGFSFKWP